MSEPDLEFFPLEALMGVHHTLGPDGARAQLYAWDSFWGCRADAAEGTLSHSILVGAPPAALCEVPPAMTEHLDRLEALPNHQRPVRVDALYDGVLRAMKTEGGIVSFNDVSVQPQPIMHALALCTEAGAEELEVFEANVLDHHCGRCGGTPDAIVWNPFNRAVQCHRCGARGTYPGIVLRGKGWVMGIAPLDPSKINPESMEAN